MTLRRCDAFPNDTFSRWANDQFNSIVNFCLFDRIGLKWKALTLSLKILAQRWNYDEKQVVKSAIQSFLWNIFVSHATCDIFNLEIFTVIMNTTNNESVLLVPLSVRISLQCKVEWLVQCRDASEIGHMRYWRSVQVFGGLWINPHCQEIPKHQVPITP